MCLLVGGHWGGGVEGEERSRKSYKGDVPRLAVGVGRRTGGAPGPILQAFGHQAQAEPQKRPAPKPYHLLTHPALEATVAHLGWTTAPGRRCAGQQCAGADLGLRLSLPRSRPSSGLEPPTLRGRVALKRETAAARARWAPGVLSLSWPAPGGGAGAVR